MKKIIKYLLMALVLSFSCSCSRFEIQDGKTGEPATISISFHSSDMSRVQTKGLTVQQERLIRNLCVLVFFPNGALISMTELENVEDDAIVDAYSYSGVGMTIYAVANYGPTLREDISKVETLDDFMKLEFSPIVDVLPDIETPESLTMVGCVKDCIIRPGNNTIDMELECVFSKITIKVIDNSTNQCFNIVEWKVVDVPLRSYLVGREDGSSCVDVENDEDFRDTRTHTFESISIDDIGRNVYSESFYLPENARGGRVDASTPAGVSSELLDGYRGKTLFAPPKATCLVIKFNTLNQPNELSDIFGIKKDGQTYVCEAKLFLGSNAVDDYNVRRGHHYVWTLIFNDSWDINEAIDICDSNVSGINTSIAVATSSSFNFDAHPDARVLYIHADRGLVSNLSVEVLDNEERHFYDDGFSATWLKISPFDRLNAQISQLPPSNLWQQDAPEPGVEGYYVRGKYIPDIARRLWLTGSQDLSASYSDEAGVVHQYTISPNCPLPGMHPPGVYNPPQGVVLGTNDYPDNDNALIWSKATHRMCYMITNIMEQIKPNLNTVKIFIFNDEFAWDGTPNALAKPREAKIRVSYDNLSSGTAVRETITYSLRQLPPLFMGRVNDYKSSGSNSHVLLIERVEEYSSVSDPNRPITSHVIKGMQWGYYGKNLYDYTAPDRLMNGWFLTANAVYDDVSIHDAVHEPEDYSWSGNRFREKYGSGYFITPTAANNYGQIIEPATAYMQSGRYGNTGEPYYYPNDIDLTHSDYSAFHPVFNASAARYCHEKNMDIDGDGNIMPWETLWYLPSQSELFLAFVEFEAIQSASSPFSMGNYWSSSESSAGNAYFLGYSSGYYDFGLFDKKMSSPSNLGGNVRCVRRAFYNTEDVVKVVDGKPLLNFSTFQNAIVTSQSKGSATGICGDNISQTSRMISKNAATIFVNLRVAMHDAHLRQENTGTPLKMSWREAVGYPASFPGKPGSKTTMTEPDSHLGVGSFDLSGQSPDDYCAMGLPASENTGCNAYYEEADKSDKGLWRLPNKRELMLMFIYQNDINAIADDMRMGSYWAASQRPLNNKSDKFDIESGVNSWTVCFGTGARDGSDEPSKTIAMPGNVEGGCYVRCVREVYSSIKYKLIYNPNGGIGGPGTVYCYGDSPVILAGDEELRHPDDKTFLGWSTDPAAVKPDYLAYSTMLMGHQTKYLYAIWR